MKVDGTNARLIFFLFFSQGQKKGGRERQARSIGSKDQQRIEDKARKREKKQKIGHAT